MKLKFLKPNLNNANKNINIVKRALRAMPEEQRSAMAQTMWWGTEITTLPLHLKPFKIMFEDANKQAPGKAWKELEEQTEKYIQGIQHSNLDQKFLEEYKTKLFNTTYQDEPQKKAWLKQYFSETIPRIEEFKTNIQKDITESKNKAYKEHLEFWIG